MRVRLSIDHMTAGACAGAARAADSDGGMPPEAVAAGTLDALRRNRTETVLGRDARWMLRVNRFLPRLVDRLLARKVRQLYAGDEVVRG